MTGFMAESLFLVMKMGGLGLFLDPAGLPLGFFETSGVDPNSVTQRVVVLFFLGLEEDDEQGLGGVGVERVGMLRGLCSEDSSSEV